MNDDESINVEICGIMRQKSKLAPLSWLQIIRTF